MADGAPNGKTQCDLCRNEVEEGEELIEILCPHLVACRFWLCEGCVDAVAAAAED